MTCVQVFLMGHASAFIFYLSYLFPFACVHFCAQPMCVPWTFLSQKRALDLLEL